MKVLIEDMFVKDLRMFLDQANIFIPIFIYFS